MQEKLWVYKECEEALVDKLSKDAGISRLMAGVFVARGVTSPDYVKEFLNPDPSKLYLPFLLQDMDVAVDRIIKAIEDKEKILIYGDYDVDGVTSTSILLDFLLSQDANTVFFIPDRFDEGYGLSDGAVEKVLQLGASLMITVDCGITAIEEIKTIKESGIDVIITDHHECKEVLPEALAVINPHRPDSEYPFKELAGVGVVFKLVQALCIVLGMGDLYLKYLDLVTLGTIADVVRLLDENRIIVKNGLKAIEKTGNVGLKALIAVAGLQDKPINTYSVGFGLAPRINAAGRTGSAARAVKLLITNDVKLAEKLAFELNEENKYRQETEKDILQQAVTYVETQVDLKKDNVIVAAGKDWHHGIIGIVASRIMERYYRPCILISEEDGVCRGSGRSIEGFNLFQALVHCGELLVKYGGHELAAGLSLEPGKLAEFRRKINEYASRVLTGQDLIPRVKIDFSIKKEDINQESVAELEMLSPFGSGNPGPVFSFNGLKISDIRGIGENKHLKLKLEDKGFYIDAVGFNMGELTGSFKVSDYLDSAFSLEINTWNNSSRVQMILKDIRPNKAIVIDKPNGYNIDMPSGAAPKREDLVAVYQYVKGNAKVDTQKNSGCIYIVEDMAVVSKGISQKYGIMLDRVKLGKCLDIFEELKLLKLDRIDENSLIISISSNGKEKVDLESSSIYRKLHGLKIRDDILDGKAI